MSPSAALSFLAKISSNASLLHIFLPLASHFPPLSPSPACHCLFPLPSRYLHPHIHPSTSNTPSLSPLFSLLLAPSPIILRAGGDHDRHFRQPYRLWHEINGASSCIPGNSYVSRGGAGVIGQAVKWVVCERCCWREERGRDAGLSIRFVVQWYAIQLKGDEVLNNKQRDNKMQSGWEGGLVRVWEEEGPCSLF